MAMPWMVVVCLLAGPLGVAGDAVPSTMMAAALTRRNWAGALNMKNHSVNFEDMKYIEMKVPKLQKDQIRIKVIAGAVDPCEWKFPMGIESPIELFSSYPLVLARDCLGTIVELGSAVDDRLKIGDVVWANQGPYKQGCACEYAAFKEELAGIAPTKLHAVEAAVLPEVSLTALDALRFTGAPWPVWNKTVLIIGGSGGVGHVAIQMAKEWGATVVTTCGTSSVELCKSFGADRVIDYHKQDWHEVLEPRSMDAVFDMVGLTTVRTGDQAYDVIRENGYFVALVPYSMPSSSSKKKRPDIKSKFSNTQYWHYKDLDIIRAMVDAGKIKPHIDKTFSFKEIVPAFKYLMTGHEHGKISMVPPNASLNTALII